MEDNEDLDSLISKPTETLSGTDVPIPAHRPKLRKIKRPKIRPMSELPAAPQKIDPEISVLESQHISSAIEETSSITGSIGEFVENSAVAENNQEEHLDTEVTSEADIKPETGSELITASDAQDMTIKMENGNPYVLDGLPPELDYITDDEVDTEGVYASDYVKKNILYIAAAVCLCLGIFIGKALFSSQKIEQHGLEGVVLNKDVPNGRPRCGLTDPSQACVIYIMNNYKQEFTGRDFYGMAAHLTEREKYMIESENMHYATVKIRPGEFAQISIPAVK